MLRVSTTHLEAFRLFSDPENDWFTEDKFLQQLRGEEPESEELRIGRAFDRVLERPDWYRVSGGYFVGSEAANQEGHFFSDAVMNPALALFHPAGVWQARGIKPYGDAVVVCKADYLFGSIVHENKTTFGSFDIEKYLSSYQWRFYVDVFQAAAVHYHVFVLGEDKRSGEFTLRSTESFSQYPYPRLRHDCAEFVDRFVEYAQRRPWLVELLEKRQRQAEEVGSL